jgi:hypothetical protein
MQVQCYWNLHRKCWSVRDAKTRKVIAHKDKLWLEDVTFKVSEAGRQRVLRERKKNVHAFACGTYVPEFDNYEPFGCYAKARYNPYKADCFVNSYTEEKVSKANYAYLAADRQVYITHA